MKLEAGLFVLAACGGGGKSPVDAAVDDPREPVVELPATANSNLDLLFVVDDSSSMADKQQNLVDNFPNFINALNMGPKGLPDIHLGVVTSDMGTTGSGSATPAPPIGQLGQGGCSGTGKGGKLLVGNAPVTGTFISDIGLPDGSRQRNYTGDLASAFSAMAKVGVGGCGFEQPLSAMRAALDNNPANAGFLRPEALLAVIFVSDEDDCSIKDTRMLSASDTTLGPLQSFRCTRFGVTCGTGGQTPDAMNQVGVKAGCTANAASDFLDTVEDFRDFVVGLKGDPSRVVITSIMGVPEPVEVELRQQPGGGNPAPALAHSCTFQGATGPEVADPGVRFKSFTDLFPGRNAFSTICQQDLSGALDLIGSLVTQSIGSPCVTRSLADVDGATPGVQVDCIVEDVVGAAKTPIQPCDAVSTPTCWKLETDAASCPSLDHLKLTVVRDSAPDPATVTKMRCIVGN